MSDLVAILTNGAASLSAHQIALATAGHNLQNVNTPGYARQRAELMASLPASDVGRGQVGRGVTLQTISQARDLLIERQIPQALFNQARSTAEADVLESVAGLNPDAEGGLPKTLGDFYSALRTLGQLPAEPGVRASVVASGRALTLAFNRTYDALEDARFGVDDTMLGLTAEINAAAKNIADLNARIAANSGLISKPNDMLDLRQLNVDRLTELTGAVSVANERGEVNMILPSGRVLVNGNRYAVASTQADVANDGHLQVLINPTDNSGPAVVANNSFGGKLGGMFDARDGALATAVTQIDQLAFDFANTFNAVHAAGFGTDGVSGRNFFTPPGVVKAAARDLAVDNALYNDPRQIAAASSAATVPGDATNLYALVATEETAMSGGSNVGKTLGTIVANYGSATSQARATAEQDSTLRQHLEKLRESASGVSIDEELIQLTRSQRAFEATMKVISTADQMLATLVNIR